MGLTREEALKVLGLTEGKKQGHLCYAYLPFMLLFSMSRWVLVSFPFPCTANANTAALYRYKKLATRYHPDNNPGCPESLYVSYIHTGDARR